MTVSRRLLAVVYLLTFATGASGLISQLVWQRYMIRLVGGDGLATAVVLGVFLGGLSVGYRLCGRWSASTPRLFRAYAVAEGLIGLWCLAFPWLFAGVDLATRSWSFDPGWTLALQGTLCAILLIGPPTLFMGATVPMLTRGLAASLAAATRTHALVYAANTAGAVLGALLAGFVLIELLGLPGALRLAGTVHLIAAGVFLALDRSSPSPAHDTSSLSPRQRAKGGSVIPEWALYGIAFAGGCAFLTFETVTIRFARLTLGSSTAAFAIVVAAFVTCVAAGSLWVAGRKTIRAETLVTNQLIACAGWIAVFLTLDVWTYVAHRLRLLFGQSPSDYAGYHASAFVLLVVVLAVPVASMGATLPLAFHLLKRELDGVGHKAGGLYSCSAAGNLVGALVGGWALLHVFDNGVVLLIGLSLIAGAAVLAAAFCGPSRRLAAAGLVVTVALVALSFPHDPTRFAVGTFRLREPLDYSRAGATAFYDGYYKTRKILSYRDDPVGTVAVVENPDPALALAEAFPGLARSLRERLAAGPERTAPRAIVINGKSDSNTWYDRETLLLAAHLPALFAASRKQALVVGLGTGVTAGELTLYPDVERIDVAEISDAVIEALPLFGEANHDVASDPRVAIHRGDGFRLVARSQAKWSIVTSEPSNPWVLGVDQLFSREFYRSVREHLEDDGVFLQWAQRYATTGEILSLVVDTLRLEFPHVRAFPVGADVLLLASTRPLGEGRPPGPAAARSLATVGVRTPADLLDREDTSLVPDAAGRGLVETLDHPRIHYLSGRAFFSGEALERGGGPILLPGG